MFSKFLALAIVLLSAQFAFSQTVEPKKSDEAKALEKEAVAFLRETLADVNGMRSLENRISFTSELAGLMWFYDEKEARGMFAGVAADFKQLLLQYDAQLNSFGPKSDEEDGDTVRGGFFGTELSDRGRIGRKFAAAMSVRQQIAMSMAEHDPDLAFGFYRDSVNALTNPDIVKKLDGGDSYFESQLIAQIAATNASKAADYAVKSLDKGVGFQHVELLKKLYAKDPGKAAEFASAILSRAKSDGREVSDIYVLGSLLEFGSSTLDSSRKPGGKKPVLSQSDLRDLADVLAQAILDLDRDYSYEGLQYAASIEKLSPARAAQIRSKFRTNSQQYRSGTNAANSVAASMNALANTSRSNMSNTASSARAEREKAEQKVLEDVAKLGSKQLPKEERDKIIAEARRVITQTPGREKKIVAITSLAAQVAGAGDKELASELMRDAENLVNPAPKNAQDFLLTWMLASGYAAADPEKAFPLLEDTIGRANDTIAAFVKAGEFFDVAEEMIQDGEVQVGAFGGQMVRGLTSELGMADATIRLLAKADFEKTKNLTNRFDRTETRVLAKMLVIRAVLGAKEKTRPETASTDEEATDEP